MFFHEERFGKISLVGSQSSGIFVSFDYSESGLVMFDDKRAHHARDLSLDKASCIHSARAREGNHQDSTTTTTSLEMTIESTKTSEASQFHTTSTIKKEGNQTSIKQTKPFKPKRTPKEHEIFTHITEANIMTNE